MRKLMEGFENIMTDYEIYGISDRYDYFGKGWGFVICAFNANEMIDHFGEYISVIELMEGLQSGDMEASNCVETIKKNITLIAIDKNPLVAFSLLYNKVLDYYQNEINNE